MAPTWAGPGFLISTGIISSFLTNCRFETRNFSNLFSFITALFGRLAEDFFWRFPAKSR